MTIATNNDLYGFFGTVRSAAPEINTPAMFATTAAAVADAAGVSIEAARDFLDSRHGRHFADTFCDARRCRDDAAALAETIRQWQGCTVSRRMSRETDIPAGLPMLTGLANHFEIMLELDA